jgi:hypothetical protein
MENAVIVCPEGNENLSGGKTFDQQCGSNWHGLTRWLKCLRALKISTPTSAAEPAAPIAANRCGPPQASSMIPSPYHSQPSPRRVERIIQTRNQRGARQRFICRMTRWSRFSMNPHSLRVTVTPSPHAEAPKRTREKILTKRQTKNGRESNRARVAQRPTSVACVFPNLRAAHTIFERNGFHLASARR